MDLIIPTMWREPLFASQFLPSYLDNGLVNKVILIDNNPADRPVLPNNVELVSKGRNIYVNPAWNEGVCRASSEIVCLLNDDIFLPAEVIEVASSLDWQSIDIVGADINPNCSQAKVSPVEVSLNAPLGSQLYGFGVCMFLPRARYKPIPSLYQIWFGDDYLVHQCERVYRMSYPFKGSMSKTVGSPDPAIQARIQLDTQNAQRYLLPRR